MSPNPWSAPAAAPRRSWWPFRRLRWVSLSPYYWSLTDGTRELAYVRHPGPRCPSAQWEWSTEEGALHYINRGDCEARELAMRLAEAAVRWELRQPRREP